jgi:hypothetical protein
LVRKYQEPRLGKDGTRAEGYIGKKSELSELKVGKSDRDMKRGTAAVNCVHRRERNSDL